MVRDLLIYHLDGTVRSYPLKGQQRLTLGRSLDADLAYPDDSILSRKHLALEKEGEEWYVVELGSKNGTTVNDEKLEENERRMLRLGDRVAAGRVTVVYDDPVEQEEQTVLFVPEQDTGGAAHMSTNLDEVVGEGKDALSSQLIANSPRMQALIEAGRELDANRPLPEVFSKVLDLAVGAVHARRGVVLTMDSGILTMRAAKGDNFRISRAVRDKVMENKESLLIIDTNQDASMRGSETIMQQNVRSLMAVPLQTKDHVFGLIYVDAQNQIRTFTPDDLNVLTVLANVAAIRVEHTRLDEVEAHDRFLQRELDQAADIQRNLLPKHAPVVKGLELAGMSVPCRSVGGDYFDYLKMPGGRVGIICGDVAGKGMAAALMMSSVQARAQMLCEETVDLGTFMTRLNRAVCTSCPGNRFITFFMCIFHPETGDFSYCNAGHNPPYLMRENGEVEMLAAGGPVLGIVRSMEYTTVKMEFRRGDTLVMYSDGVTEARSAADEEYGEDRFLARLQSLQLQGESAGRTVDAIYQEVEQFMTGVQAADDITLVVARRV